jgi:hypothetical protein
MEDQRRPFQPFFKMLFDFYLFCSYLVDSGLFPDDQKYQPLKILYAKCSLSLLGIHGCLSNGLLSESSVLLRSLFETFLNVRLILESDTDLRLQLYAEFQYVEQWNNLCANRRLLSAGGMTPEQFSRTFSETSVTAIEKNFDRVKHNYHPKQPYHWAWLVFKHTIKDARNPSISYIADHLDLAFDYVKVYSALSISVHNSPSLVHQVSTGKGVSLAPLFTKTMYNSGSLALDYVAKITEGMVRYFRFRDPDEIVTYTTAFALTVLDQYDPEKR